MFCWKYHMKIFHYEIKFQQISSVGIYLFKNDIGYVTYLFVRLLLGINELQLYKLYCTVERKKEMQFDSLPKWNINKNAKTKAVLMPRDQFKLHCFFICFMLHQTKVLGLTPFVHETIWIWLSQSFLYSLLLLH